MNSSSELTSPNSGLAVHASWIFRIGEKRPRLSTHGMCIDKPGNDEFSML